MFGLPSEGNQPGTPEALRIFRLAEIGKLWTYLDYFHPDTERQIKWRKALNDALGKISIDSGHDEYIGIIEQMLFELRDPTTSFRKGDNGLPNSQKLKPGFPSFEWIDRVGGILLVSLNDPGAFSNVKSAVEKLNVIANVALHAKAIVFDIRSLKPGQDNFELSAIFEESNLTHIFTGTKQHPPEQFARFYYGLEPSTSKPSGGYEKWRKLINPLARLNKSIETISDSPNVNSTRPVESTSNKFVIFIVNQNTCLPSTALALQMNGLGYIISEGIPRAAIAHLARTIEIPGVGFVDVRLSEFGSNKVSLGGFRPNEIIEEMDKNSILERAREIINEPQRANLLQVNFYSPKKAKKYKTSIAKRQLPRREDRLFAAFKIWTVFNYFFPYKNLMDSDWDQVLLYYLPQFENCKSASDYVCAVTEMLSHVKDTHVWITGDSYYEHFGFGDPPFGLRMIEGQAVVTHITGDAEEKGLHLGDVLLSIDGEAIGDRMNRFRKFIAASTPQSENARLLSLILDGPIDSSVTISVFDGHLEKTVLLKRNSRHTGDIRYSPPQRVNAVEIMPNNIGYVDLTRLKVDQIDGMFTKCRNTIAIIFDMRGYPHGTGWLIAARLITRQKAGKIERMQNYSSTSVASAVFRCPTNPAEVGSKSYEFTQFVNWSDKSKYRGLTILLIDERAISQSEHTGLYFKAAHGTTFVGSSTAGANGDITNFAIPGGLTITLTGQSVEHPDGTRLQRVGLTPDVEVAPTIKAIRNGQDEVLERAIQFVLNNSGIV